MPIPKSCELESVGKAEIPSEVFQREEIYIAKGLGQLNSLRRGSAEIPPLSEMLGERSIRYASMTENLFPRRDDLDLT